MAINSPPIPNTFTANTSAKSAEVNANFSALRNAMAAFVAVSGDYTVLDGDGYRFVYVTAGGTGRTVTLPTAADNEGRVITVKKVDAGIAQVGVVGEGAETVDGAAFGVTLSQLNEFVTVHSNGSVWRVIGGNVGSVVGSGGGAGSVNYIQSSSKAWDFETDTTGWNVFRDGSAVEDGTGGSPTLTVARNTTTPLNGTADLKITKPSGNQQWSGTSIDVDVPRAYQLGAKCELSFLYDFSAQTAAGDWQFYIYDVDNATRITPANNDIPKAFGRISTSWDCTTSANYRLIIACVDSDTAGYDVFVDDVVIGPGKVVNGYPGSDWTAYTPTISNLGTGSTASVQGYWRRNGPDLFCRVTWVKDGSGGSGASSVNISIPSGLTIDTTKLTSNGNAIVGVSSHYNMPTSSQFDETNSVAYRTTTTVAILRPGTADFYTGGAIPSGAQVDMEFSVPIAEWAGGSAYLGQSDTQECVIAYNTSSSSGKALNTFNLVQFNTEEVDTANCFASNTFTARTAGYFRVDASVTVAPGTNFTRTVLSLFKNSATEVARFYDESHDSTTQWVIMSGSSVFKLEAGDSISAHVYATGSGNYTVYGTANGAQTRITITRVSVDGSVIGFGAATATSMGLVKGGTVPGQVSGASVAAGHIGEVLTASLSDVSFSVSGTGYTLGSLSLTAGVWMVYAQFVFGANGGSSHSESAICINTAATFSGAHSVSDGQTNVSNHKRMFVSRVVNLASTSTIYAMGYMSYSGGSPTTTASTSNFYAVRIA